MVFKSFIFKKNWIEIQAKCFDLKLLGDDVAARKRGSGRGISISTMVLFKLFLNPTRRGVSKAYQAAPHRYRCRTLRGSKVISIFFIINCILKLYYNLPVS